MSVTRIQEGFEGQQLYILSPRLRNLYKNHPLIQNLMPTNLGYFPDARYHYCDRPTGCDESILIVPVRGSGWCRVAGNEFELEYGQAVFIPTKLPHVYGSSDDNPWSIYWAHCTGITIDAYTEYLRGYYCINVAEDVLQEIITLFDRSIAVYSENFVLKNIIYTSHLLHYIYGRLLFHNSAFSVASNVSYSHQIQRVVKFLKENIEANFKLADIADIAGLSQSHFSKLFREEMRYAPMEYFTHLKLQRACLLLKTSDKNIQEIAASLGYHDPYYFSRLFKKIVGVSPSYYRSEIE